MAQRGSPFVSLAQPRYIPEDQRQQGLTAIRLLLSGWAEEEAMPDVSGGPCDLLSHEFVESSSLYHTMECTECGMMVEHLARWYARYPHLAPPDLPPTEAYE